MADSYRPLFGRVLLERSVQSKTKGGIILTDAKRHALCKGKIIALGETAGWTRAYDAKGEPKMVRAINVGDVVSFGRHAGTWLDASYGVADNTNDEAPFFLCQDEDLLAVIEGE